MKSISYKIRRISDGHFSTGGKKPKFVKNGGKYWSSLQEIEIHLASGVNKFRNDIEVYEPFLQYKGCEIVEYLMSPSIIEQTPSQIINKAIDKEASNRTDYYGELKVRKI